MQAVSMRTSLQACNALLIIINFENNLYQPPDIYVMVVARLHVDVESRPDPLLAM